MASSDSLMIRRHAAVAETVDAIRDLRDSLGPSDALIDAIRPDVLIKGADYSLDEVVGGDKVQAYGGKVVLAELTPGQSTTGTISRMSK